ncbi:MAG: T9SS type A sorting domain-containing protein [Fluviicola sp.]|nr:T9SS type A sorting domain-containing protein [Fluviicola sp.]
MKKLLLFISITLISVASVNAQCVPDPQYTTPGIYPDSATGMAGACVGVAYSEVITNIIPLDTCVEVIPNFPCVTLVFDSVVITSFTGLPPGYTYQCNDIQNTVSPANSCTFEGNTAGCVIIDGTSVIADTGTYNLVITVDVYLAGGATPQATQIIDWYSIVVTDCTVGLDENAMAKISAYPNPTENVLTIDGLSGLTESITITDANGKIMNNVEGISTSNYEMNVSDLESGIYFIQIKQNNDSRVIRFVKK